MGPQVPGQVPAAEAHRRRQARIVASYLALAPGMEEDELLNTLLTCAMAVVRAEGAAVTIFDPQEKVSFFGRRLVLPRIGS